MAHPQNPALPIRPIFLNKRPIVHPPLVKWATNGLSTLFKRGILKRMGRNRERERAKIVRWTEREREVRRRVVKRVDKA